MARLGAVFILGTLGALAVAACGSEDDSRATSARIEAAEADKPRFATVRWDELDQAIAHLPREPARRAALVGELASCLNPTARYLRGMVLLAEGRPDDALAEFDLLAPSEIPADYLYAPYRLHRALRPGAHNRYHTALRIASSRELLTPLVEARLAAHDARLKDSLVAYQKTDPARWARQDRRNLMLMARHEGLGSEVRHVVEAALKGGRINAEKRSAFAKILEPAPEVAPDRFRELVRSDRRVRKMAVASARSVFESRRMFLANDDEALIRRYEDVEPGETTTEAALLLFLSSLRVGDQVSASRWGQELRRRHPEREIRNWVEGLLAGTDS